jgi:hypothetical protein
MIRSFQIGQLNVDEKDPWSGVLSATMFATRATYHTTLQATPAQLVFGRDAIMNTKFTANWELIHKQKNVSLTKTIRKKIINELPTNMG